MNPIRVSLNEWETARPDPATGLAGRNFDGNLGVRKLAEELTDRNQLTVFELARGIELRASSFVGRVQLGEIEVTIRPKISGAPLLNLFRYAYGLRDLQLYGTASYNPAHGSFQDLLIQQLAEEVQEIITRGLHRDYLPRFENLASPRGRIDFNRLSRKSPSASNSLPCVHHPRSEDTLINQVLLAGLLLGSRLSTDLDLRARLQRLAKMLRLSVSLVSLDARKLQAAWSALDRRTVVYESSLTLIELLNGAAGVSLADKASFLSLHGFLFDMNRFFQALISRFLRESLVSFEVQDERRLKGMFTYDPLRNPLKRQATTPRPDFVVTRNAELMAVLDAKYRDLWEKPLPRSMLYQLAIYALGHDQLERRAAILYPTSYAQAAEQSITIQEAVKGGIQARVDLRPVNLFHLNELLQQGEGLEARRRREKLANQLAFGQLSSKAASAQ
jgi:5-methylcytosine-specific restriction enzyme subunit McrC